MRLPLPLVELCALFRSYPPFRRVFLADVATQLGDGGLLIAFPMLILERTHDVTLTGLAFSGEILAFGLMSPLAGVWADRFEQKWLMIGANLARVALFALLLAGLFWKAPVWVFMVLSIALGGAGAFFMPARAAFLRRLLDGADLERAIALEGTMGFLLRLIAPPLMGLVLAFYPATVGVVVDMAAYLVAVALLAPRFVTAPPLAEAGSEPRGAWQEGWRLIGRTPALRGLIALDAALSLVGMAAFAITIAFLEQALHLGAQANAGLLAATGLAGAIGAQLAGKAKRLPGVYAWLVAAIALTYLLVPLAGSLPVLMAFWALRGLAIGAFAVLINQRVAATVPAAVMGRVHAAWGLIGCLAAFGGSAATPVLLRTLGAAQSYTLFGCMLVAVLTLMVGAAIIRRARPLPVEQPLSRV